ncbi:MAG: radical SAM protein [Thermodesulforhabdaceae bacterium]
MTQPRILFIQLPVQSHDYYYNLGHVPLASGVLAAFLKHRLPDVEVIILDNFLTSCASTPTLINHILSIDPSIIAFGCYLWNIERSIFIARTLRQQGLKSLMIAGGPEIHPDNSLLFDPSCPFDILVTGEGERALYRIISALGCESGFEKGSFVKADPISLLEIPSPYLMGILPPSPEGNLLIETSRGCPYHCAYCYYHHNVSRMAEFPIERTVQEIRWARQQGLKKITFVDPSFTSRRNLSKFLDVLSEINSDRFFSFSAELNAELCDDALARMLSKAGFNHVEVGLQSINSKALKAINRPVRIDAFVKGVKALRKYGIKVMVDLIVGLPEETPESFIQAVNFCVSEDLSDELSIYPLSILPGTELKKRSGELGIFYDPYPPYYVKKTLWMDEEAVRQILRYAEDLTGIDYFPPEFPRLHPIPGELSHLWSLTAKDDVSSWSQIILKNSFLGQAVTLRLERNDWWTYQEEFAKFFENLLQQDPFMLVSWVIPEETITSVPLKMRLRIFEKFFPKRNHYKDRELFSTSSSMKSSQVFVQISHQSLCDGITLLWITLELISGQNDELWFLTTCDEASFPEKYALYRSSELLGISEDVPYKVTFIS